MNDLTTRPLHKADFDHIVTVIDKWWGGPTSALAHPIYFYELGQLARVVEYEGHMVGFLFGSSPPDGPVGYVHLVGIHPDFRRRGVARLLYSSFEADCKQAGAKRMKAITTMGNEGSVRFTTPLDGPCKRSSTTPDVIGTGLCSPSCSTEIEIPNGRA